MTTHSSHDQDGLELMDNLVQVSFAVTAALNRVAAKHDLSLTQLRVLGILRDREPTMAQLATHLGLERSTVSGLVDRAAQRGLVRRDGDPEDRRCARVSLTSEARSLGAEIVPEIRELITPMVDRLGSSERKRLAALLDTMLGR